MKAIVWTAYGPPDVLLLKEIDRPTPKDNEVQVKVNATTVTAGDCEARSLQFPLWLSLPVRLFMGLSKPREYAILGQEFAGEIEAVGKDVKSFREGDLVFGATGFGLGTYAEYVTLPEDAADSVVVIKPDGLSFEEAATIPTGGLESLHFLRKANIQPGERVVVNGAGGSIGTYGVQLAKLFGAEVTAVDSAEKLAMLRSIGADHVIDYKQEDFTNNGETYDVIFDVVGKSPYSRSVKALKPAGRYLIANPTLSLMMRAPWTSRTSDKTVSVELSKRKPEDLVYLAELIESGKMTAVIDRRYPLQETAEAHHYVETGRKKGNLVITVVSDS